MYVTRDKDSNKIRIVSVLAQTISCECGHSGKIIDGKCPKCDMKTDIQAQEEESQEIIDFLTVV